MFSPVATSPSRLPKKPYGQSIVQAERRKAGPQNPVDSLIERKYFYYSYFVIPGTFAAIAGESIFVAFDSYRREGYGA